MAEVEAVETQTEIVSEPAETCEIHVGDFTFNLNGVQESREFKIHATPPDGSPRTLSHNMDAENEQLTDAFYDLLEEGCTDIKYLSVVPDPL